MVKREKETGLVLDAPRRRSCGPQPAGLKIDHRGKWRWLTATTAFKAWPVCPYWTKHFVWPGVFRTDPSFGLPKTSSLARCIGLTRLLVFPKPLLWPGVLRTDSSFGLPKTSSLARCTLG